MTTPRPTYDDLRAWLLEAEAHIDTLETRIARLCVASGAAVSAGYVRRGYHFGAGSGDDYEPPAL